MGVGAGLYMYDVVVKKFTFAISSPDEFLFTYCGVTPNYPKAPHSANFRISFLFLVWVKLFTLNLVNR